MNGIIPDKLTLDSHVTVQFDQQSVMFLAMAILIVIVLAFLAQRAIKKA